MIIKLLNGTLVALLVVGCAIEEPDTSGTLSLDPNYGEAPEGVSVQDVDIVKDGVIDIHDLVAVAYFYEQEVPDTEVAKTSEDTDESAPCRNLEGRFPEMDRVTDNSNYKQIFEVNGNKYVYALLGLRTPFFNTYTQSEPRNSLFPLCVAVRFYINDDLTPTKVKIKPVAGGGFSEAISSPLLEITTFANTTESKLHTVDTLEITEDTNYLVQSIKSKPKNGNRYSNRAWRIEVYKYINPNFKTKLQRQSQVGKLVFPDKIGIPIGDDSVITSFEINPPQKNFFGSRKWALTDLLFYRILEHHFSDPFYGDREDKEGVYVNMSPTEVRARYFPEDIE